jgi:hypothetical protein
VRFTLKPGIHVEIEPGVPEQEPHHHDPEGYETASRVHLGVYPPFGRSARTERELYRTKHLALRQRESTYLVAPGV